MGGHRRVHEGEVRSVSFVCRMVIGYYDPKQIQPHELVRYLVFDRLLDLEKVAQLQTACDEIFDIQIRLADHLTEPGALVIQGGSISRDMFCVHAWPTSCST